MALLPIAATSSFFHVTLPSPYSGVKGTKFGGGPMGLGGLKSNNVSSGCCLQLKVKAQAPSTVNGTTATTSIQKGGVSSQNFSIRSYEVGADGKISIETLMSYLQEASINHFTTSELDGGFGTTPKMCKMNLIWVVTQMRVTAYRYPAWLDDVEVKTWASASGKIGMRINWLLSDYKTGEILTKATGVFVMMNNLTRRISKIPEEVRSELGAYFVNSARFLEEDNKSIPKLDDNTADYIFTGLNSRWSDLDLNQHVNNVRFISWIMESVPHSIMESHELCGMTLKYRRECGKDNELQSLIVVSGDADHSGHLECNHLLRLEDGAEAVRGRTEWSPKQ